MNEKSSLGIDPRLAAALGYLGFLGIIWLVIEKESRLVKNHALQSTAIFVVSILAGIIGMIPIFGWILGPILGLGCMIFWIIGLINAIQGQEYVIPYVGPVAANLWDSIVRSV